MTLRGDYAADRTLLPRVMELLGVVFPGVPDVVAAAEQLGLRWNEASTPFVVTDGAPEGRVLAHVGVLELPLVVAGERVRAAGVHAVAVHPDARRQGLFRRCMEAALAHIDVRFDLAVLSTAQPGLYTPFGFREVAECRFTGPAPAAERGDGGRVLDYADAPDVALLRDQLLQRAPVSSVFGVVEETAVFAFQQATAPPLYVPALEALLVFEIRDGVLRLYDVVAPRMPTLAQVVGCLPVPVERVEVYFEPAHLAADLASESYVLDGDDLMCVRGPLGCEGSPFLWPRPARC